MGIYIVAVAALFFLAFAYFAVAQAGVRRNTAQTAADAAALAAARNLRDEVRTPFLDALLAGDTDALTRLLNDDQPDNGSSCGAADTYAEYNGAARRTCRRVDDPPGYTVSVRTNAPVGKSVVPGTEGVYATATATAVVEPRCGVGDKDGHTVRFTCTGGDLTVDPTADGFALNLSDFYSVHLAR